MKKLTASVIFAVFTLGAASLCCPARADKQQDELRAMVNKDYANAEDAIRAAMAGSHRKPGHNLRDYWRHPFETLTFFGLKPNMKVIELSPGGGWYTEILAPVVYKQGQLRVTVPAPKQNAEEPQYVKAYLDVLAAHPEVFDKVVKVPIGPPKDVELGPEGSADLVLTFRNLHNWYEGGYLDEMFAAVFKVLKKGGVFGVVEHRAKAGAKPEDGKKSGYMPQAWVIQRAEAAGFKLQKKSEINANPKDTKDYKDGVWTLSPNFAAGAANREKIVAIGESDRMTLRFVKP